KLRLLGGAAAVALLTMSSASFAQENGGAVDDVDIDYYNDLDARISIDVEYDKDVALLGGALLGGIVLVDSSGVALVDSKQVLSGNDVNFREENWIAGSNGSVDGVYGPGREQAATTLDGNGSDPYVRRGFTPTGRIEAGYFVPVINTVDTLNV